MFANRSTRFNPYSLRTNLQDAGETTIITPPATAAIEILNTTLLRTNLGIVSTEDPYKSKVVFLSYCNKFVRTSGSTFTDETGKTITLFNSGSVPARCYVGGYKSGNLFFPGVSENESANINYCQLLPSDILFGNDNWTLEFIVSAENWFNGAAYYGAIFWIQRNFSDQFGLEFSYYNQNLRIGPTGGFNSDTRIFSWLPENNRIYYIAARRIGNYIEIAIDGVRLGLAQLWTTAIPTFSSPYRIGGDSFNNHGAISFHGIRITIGIARDIFTIPSIPWVY